MGVTAAIASPSFLPSLLRPSSARARMRSGLDEPAGAKAGLTSVPFLLCAGFLLDRTSSLTPDG